MGAWQQNETDHNCDSESLISCQTTLLLSQEDSRRVPEGVNLVLGFLDASIAIDSVRRLAIVTGGSITFNDHEMIWWLLLVYQVHHASAIEYPWTFDNDLFGAPRYPSLMRTLKGSDQDSCSRLKQTCKAISKQYNVEGTFENIGQLPIITINETLSKNTINITGGPASPYRYRLHQVQLLAYNVDLYTNYSQAVTQPRGLLAIAVIIDIGTVTEVALRRLTVASQSITYKGMRTTLRQLHPAGLLPRTHHYVTYEGSLTIPGCQETVTWIIMNNPIYITREDKTESKQADPAYMTPAYRPLKALNGRLLRTNINVNYRQTSSPTCSSNIYTEMGYRSNPARARHNQSITKRSAPKYVEREVFELEKIEPESISNVS
ncbi:carbonate dehydratase, eukaryotic-type [Teladorsagia circumcincta]|uniref:Carbonate dehydratase, eukaryotic-type n=1 Tax=Teladorsagia circumcincta TaxID=45464 RepID=A0A2G9UY19_TELCI|nr:carbonate dehydratase, eukaryotic-type [Teladorsagia circumcincta]